MAVHRISDMLVVPDPDTAVMDPFTKEPDPHLICDISDPITRADYSRDPRNIARKAEAYLKSTGIADTAYFGPEPEFFIFDGIRFDTNQHSATSTSSRRKAAWNSGKEGANLGYKPRYKEGYFPVAAQRQPAGHPHRDGARDGARRHPGREAASRSRDRRPGRNRHALSVAGENG